MNNTTKDLKWVRAKVTKPFHSGRTFSPGEMIGVSDNIRISHMDFDTPIHPVTIHVIFDEWGTYHFILPSHIPFAGMLAEISGKYGLVPVGSVSVIKNIEQYFEIVEDDEDESHNGPWDKISSGNYIIYDPSSDLLDEFFTKGQMYPVFRRDFGRMAGDLEPCNMLVVGGDDCKTHRIRLHRKDGKPCVKDFFKLPCQMNNPLEDKKPVVSARESMMYFLTEYREDTSLVEMIEHLPSDESKLHVLDDALFRIVCLVGNSDGIGWFIHNCGCSVSSKALQVPTLTSALFRAEFGLIYEDDPAKITNLASHIIDKLNTYCAGHLASPRKAIIMSKNLEAISKYVDSIPNSSLERYKKQGLWDEVIIECLVVNDFDMETKIAIMKLFKVSVCDLIDLADDLDKSRLDKDTINMFLDLITKDGDPKKMLLKMLQYVIFE